MDIAGKNALVTGAASGIGRATCEAFADKGAAHIHLVDVNAAGLEETARLCRDKGTECTVHVCNVGDLAALEATFADANAATPLDIVYNNAGIVTGAPLFPDGPVSRIEAMTDININAVFAGTRFAIDHMKGRGGVVVNTGSTSYNSTTFPDILYIATKAAVFGFTAACAQLEQSHGVRVCSVLPGLVDTPIVNTTGDGGKADWMERILRDNEALPPSALAAGVVGLVEDDACAGENRVVRAGE